MDGSQKIQHVSLTGLASSYVLTQSGARKLIDADPLAKLIPVDDYISVLQDIREYCNVDLVDAWPPEQRNLQVLVFFSFLRQHDDVSDCGRRFTAWCALWPNRGTTPTATRAGKIPNKSATSTE